MLIFLLVLFCFSESRISYFWHISDLHLDLEYAVGTNAVCGTYFDRWPKQCCRVRMNSSMSPFTPAQRFGTPYHKCDLPLETYDLLLGEMSRIQPDPVAVFVTGDIPGHDLPVQTMDSNVHYFSTVMSRLNAHFPNSPSLFSMGNHDAWPTNLLAHPPLSDWLLVPTSVDMVRYGWLSVDTAAQFAEKGYFSVEVVGTTGRLRIVSLETQWVSRMNILIPRNWNASETQEMVSWFESEMEEARAKGQKVVLLGHIPPDGGENAFPEWNTAYSNIVSKYRDVIWLSLFGHTHKDRFGLIRDAETGTQVKSYYLIAGAMTPFSSQFPTAKLISYDSDTLQIIDIVTYFSNITRANEKTREGKNNAVTLEKEYSMRKFYGLTSFDDPAQFEVVAKRLLAGVMNHRSQSSQFADEFFLYLFGSSRTDCDAECRKKEVCEVLYLRDEFREKCLESF